MRAFLNTLRGAGDQLQRAQPDLVSRTMLSRILNLLRNVYAHSEEEAYNG